MFYMKKTKKIIFCLIVVIIIMIIMIFFIKSNYKNNKIGNNKTIEEIENYILNIKTYKATLEVTIRNNRNENNYKIVQEVTKEYEKQITLKPDEINGLEMIFKNGKLEIKNTELNLTKIYENYPNVSENNLFLTQFIQSYANKEENNKSINIKDENEIVLKVKTNKNRYDVTQLLYVNKENLKPKKLEILDNNNNTKVYILYNEIEINI